MTTKRPRIFIDGEAGTTGLEIRQRLEGRHDIELLSIDPARRKEAQARAELLDAADLAILCLHDDAAREAVRLCRNPQTRFLDASTAHRTAQGWVYGFPELNAEQSRKVASARLVSNPGCYATGAVALLFPLVARGLLDAQSPVSVLGLSGYSGGGRELIEAHEVAGAPTLPTCGPLRGYALSLTHKHRPEIKEYAGLAREPLFVPQVGSWKQGMLLEVPLPAGMVTASADELRGALAEHYAGQPYVRVYTQAENPAVLDPETLNGTNNMELFVYGNAQGDTLLVARLDNLGKGASGAAVQNMELMLGL